MAHSKHNTSSAIFTAHERSQLRGQWGSQSTRLTRDSFLPFGSCRLCLLPSRDPVSCPTHGHIFCRECAVSNLLAQKKEITRLASESERRKEGDIEEQRRREDAELAERVKDFEAIQAGLDVKLGSSGERRLVGRGQGKVAVEEHTTKGTKRKLELDEDELRNLGREHKVGRKEETKPTLPGFWIPSATPGQDVKREEKPLKQAPVCPASTDEAPHEFSLKTLVSVHFAEEKDGATDEVLRNCPACNKALSNSTKAVLAKPCGHVVCKTCAENFLKPAERDAHDLDAEIGVVRCYVCQTDVTESKKSKKDKSEKKKDKIRPGLVDISTEGTGFAGGGTNMVKRSGVSFQC
ncbi:hypothetical protein MBLNU457_4892t1 [Dothideomycetes sp. NU457]